jgi:hypothetical protein
MVSIERSISMHNCKEAKEQLTELLLDGDSRAEEVLDQCVECRAEFEALAATLRMTTRLRETVTSSESYWTGYHEQLRQRLTESFHAKAQRLRHAKVQRKEIKPGLGFVFASLRKPLRLCVKTFLLPVRVPLGFALLAVGLVFALLAIRTARTPATQPPLIVHVPVEVPVVQEKTVTQVIYRDRHKPLKSAKRSVVAPTIQNTFAQFKPTDDVKLTVIKGGSPNEK